MGKESGLAQSERVMGQFGSVSMSIAGGSQDSTSVIPIESTCGQIGKHALFTSIAKSECESKGCQWRGFPYWVLQNSWGGDWAN